MTEMASHDDTESLLGIGRDRYVPVYKPRAMVLDHGAVDLRRALQR